MTKDGMQRYLIQESKRGSSELEAYRNLMDIIGIEFPKRDEKSDQIDAAAVNGNGEKESP